MNEPVEVTETEPWEPVKVSGPNLLIHGWNQAGVPDKIVVIITDKEEGNFTVANWCCASKSEDQERLANLQVYVEGMLHLLKHEQEILVAAYEEGSAEGEKADS